MGDVDQGGISWNYGGLTSLHPLKLGPVGAPHMFLEVRLGVEPLLVPGALLSEPVSLGLLHTFDLVLVIIGFYNY